MSTEEARYGLGKLRGRYIRVRLTEITLLALGTGLLTNAFARLITPVSMVTLIFSIVAGLVVFLMRMKAYHINKLDDGYFTRYLNGQYPQMQESADLLLRDDHELTLLQQIQKVKALEQFNLLYPGIKLPNHILQSLGIFGVCTITYFALTAFSVAPTPAVSEKPFQKDKTTRPISADAAILIHSISITITPPDYTRIKPISSNSPDLIIPEGSRVKWSVKFTGLTNGVKIIFSGRDSINLVKDVDDDYFIEEKITSSGFYQVQWRDGMKTHRSDYHKMEVIKDQPPKITIHQLNQFTQVDFNDNLSIGLHTSLTDDYGLTNAYIIATVSKGSGESVKFREEKLQFMTPEKIVGKQIQAERGLDLKKLGLEPGDELYFYVEAYDNRTPTANHNRTETYFIAVQDTAAEITTADAGLGVDLMPEYFRSQRQIIIDTEKLLKEKKKLTRQQFNNTSNELGYDQKVLRLRYGQFMGEEAESGIGISVTQEQVSEPEVEKDKDVTKEFSHQHDTENEHNLVDQKKQAPGGHDNTEEATFFDQSIKAKLKAALTIMWDAELYLRLYEPAKSLPYQYKVLNLLKEISNDSRIYVHRTGFDPPPLKEDRRLTAELTEIKSSRDEHNGTTEDMYPGVREALGVVEEMLQNNVMYVTPRSQKTLTSAGREISVLLAEQPGLDLRSLALLKTLVDQKVAPDDMHNTLVEIRTILWKLLPPSSPSPVIQGATVHALDQTFLNSLEGLRHE